MKRLVWIITFTLIGWLIWKGSVSLFGKERQLSFSGKTLITINDDGLIYRINSDAVNMNEFEKKHRLRINEKDLIYPNGNEQLFPGMVVEIWRSREVKIEVDGKVIEQDTFAKTVEAALFEADVRLGRLDKTEPAKLKTIGQNEKIIVTRINIEDVIETKELDFERIEKNDNKLQWKKNETEQVGEKGEKVIEYRITYRNGKEISKEVISSKVTKKPIAEIVRIGTKIKVGKVKTGISSWYRYTGKLTCASRIFPRGTWLRVTNNENGKQVIVEVRDFGPEKWTGRRIDLEAVAFEKIAPLGKGLVNVKVEEILQ